MTALIATYQQQIRDYTAQSDQAKQQLRLLGWLRLLCFAAALFFGYQFVKNDFAAGWLLPVFVLLAVFIYALARYQRVQDRITLLAALLQLNEKELRLVTTGESGFDAGDVFAEEEHAYSGDLDVFGQASLYAHMNRTGTLMGGRQLATFLQAPLQEVPAILQTQDALRELASRFKFRQLFTAHATLSGETPGDVASLHTWLHLPLEFLSKRWLQIAIWLSPALLLLSVIYAVFTSEYYLSTLFLCINWLLLGTHVKKVNAQHQLISNKEKIFRKFGFLLELIKKEKIEGSALLKSQQGTAMEAGMALQRLARVSSALDQRLNLVIGVFLNSIVLYDLHCAFALERWKTRYREDVPGWLAVIANMEAWNSMATFTYNHPAYIFPQVDDTAVQLLAKGVGHPLIPAEDCVKNDVQIGAPQDFLIITGSNMSGKSTFLRSVGSNLLLALCGMPVCAETFTCSPMRIMTSMRIKDSIAKHTSYFQAELLRLQQIVAVLKSGQPVFILLDEILKGTNSEDKLSGSRRLIENFLQYNCLGMIATHDLELGHLEAAYPQQIRNYCFESTIQDDDLFFDYRIREGIARNKNATFLMQKMEII